MIIRRLLKYTALVLTVTTTSLVQAGVYDEILFAANQGQTDQVIDLLRRGMDVNTTDQQGNTLLMIAVRTDNMNLAKFLIQNRANAQRRNSYGDNALMLAALKGQDEIVGLMLERKPEINHGGWNPLQYASYEGHVSVITMLLASKADINMKAPNGHTPLMLAAKRGHIEAVRALVGSNADTNITTSDEGTALDMARKAGHTEIVAFLEKAGAR